VTEERASHGACFTGTKVLALLVQKCLVQRGRQRSVRVKVRGWRLRMRACFTSTNGLALLVQKYVLLRSKREKHRSDGKRGGGERGGGGGGGRVHSCGLRQ
jgi:hypothetical protein